MNQDRRSLDTRNKILEVAEKEFALYGYSGAHLQGIAEQVGVQKTALYYYFPSKSALYSAVLENMLEALNDTITRATKFQGNGEERLERLVGDINDLLAERRYYSKILIRIFVDRAPFHYRTLQKPIESVIGQLLVFYREGVEAGHYRRLSARHFFMSVMGMTFFHYAVNNFAAAILGVEDIFTRSSVAWRRKEVGDLLAHGILPGAASDDESDES